MASIEESDLVDPQSPHRRDRPILGLLVWLMLAVLWLLVLFGAPEMGDSISESRLVVFGAIAVLGTGLWALPRAWRTTRPELVHHPRLARLGWAVLSIMVLVVGTLIANLVLNSRSSVALAFGSDEMRGGEVLLLRARVAQIHGPLSAGIGAKLAELVARHPDIELVVLESPGGWMREGELLARTISRHALRTHTDEECLSACTVAFLAGRHRSLARAALLGFHGVSSDGADAVYEREWTRDYVDHLLDGQVSSAFRERVMHTPRDDMWYPTTEELLEEGLVNEIMEP